MGKFTVLLGSLAVIAMVGQAEAAIQLINNGSFETGDFTAWQTYTQTASNAGWYIGTPGEPTPLTAWSTAPNPLGGSYYAVSDEYGASAHALLQPFTVPLNTTSLILSFQMFVNQYAGRGQTVNSGDLDYTGSGEYGRVDILTAGAGAFSTAAADVVSNLYAGADPHGSNPNLFTSYSFNLTGLTPGSTYQLRFADVETRFFLNTGVDNVSMLAETISHQTSLDAIPEPSAFIVWSLLGSLAIGLGWWRKRKGA